MVRWDRTECLALRSETPELSLWDGKWDDHKLGWIICGATTLAATLVASLNLVLHGRNYYRAKEQRQVMRILMLPVIVSLISFLSFHFFRTYTYYSMLQTLYAALTVGAFIGLLCQMIADASGVEKTVVLARRRRLPFPFSFLGYKPSKAKSLSVLKWTVLQYSIVQPAIGIAGVITHAFSMYCPTAYSVNFSAIYLDSAAGLSVTIALLGLVAFYTLAGELLEGNQPKAKFLGLGGILAITFYQSFLFSFLAQYDVIKPTKYWATAEHLQSLILCSEMVLFSLSHLYAFPWRSYSILRPPTVARTPLFRSILDSVNYADLFFPCYRTPSSPGLSLTHAFGRSLPPASPDFRTSIDSAFSMHDWDGEKPLPEPSQKRVVSWGGTSASSVGLNESRIPVEAFLGLKRRSSAKGWNTFTSQPVAGAGIRRRESYAANADEPYGFVAEAVQRIEGNLGEKAQGTREKEQVIHIPPAREKVDEEEDEESQESHSDKDDLPPETPDKEDWEGRRDYIS